jgi:hypothetical protein
MVEFVVAEAPALQTVGRHLLPFDLVRGAVVLVRGAGAQFVCPVAGLAARVAAWHRRRSSHGLAARPCRMLAFPARPSAAVREIPRRCHRCRMPDGPHGFGDECIASLHRRLAEQAAAVRQTYRDHYSMSRHDPRAIERTTP